MEVPTTSLEQMLLDYGHQPTNESNTIYLIRSSHREKNNPRRKPGAALRNKKLSAVHSAGQACSVHRAVRPDRAVAAVGPASAGRRHPAVGRAWPGRLGAVGQDSVGSDCS